MRLIRTLAVGAFAVVAMCVSVGCPKTQPPPGFGISVGVTATQTGPDVCITGMSFSASGSVQTGYVNIPGSNPNRTGPSGTASSTGTFVIKDTSMDTGGLIHCSDQQIQQNVAVSATDKTTGNITFGSVPGAYWCSNASVATNFNGGCH